MVYNLIEITYNIYIKTLKKKLRHLWIERLKIIFKSLLKFNYRVNAM